MIFLNHQRLNHKEIQKCISIRPHATWRSTQLAEERRKIALAYLQVGRTSKEGSCTEPFYPDIAGDNSPSVPKLVYFPGTRPWKYRYCSASLSITSEFGQLMTVYGLQISYLIFANKPRTARPYCRVLIYTFCHQRLNHKEIQKCINFFSAHTRIGAGIAYLVVRVIQRFTISSLLLDNATSGPAMLVQSLG